MKKAVLSMAIFGLFRSLVTANMEATDFEKYPSVVISNTAIKMQIYPPDPENGLYRATRFDWSGAIGSVQYKGHEYFGYWRDRHDPMSPVGIMGPADTYKTAGLGYDEATAGQGFIRIGVGLVKKEDEPAYDYHKDYIILDHGNWAVDKGDDWITFTHIINSDLGYGYVYKKELKLKDDGFLVVHTLRNTGIKPIETDQYSHNFFMIDREKCDPSLQVRYPFPVTTNEDLKGLMKIENDTLHFIKEIERNTVFMGLEGYGDSVMDNSFTIENTTSHMGVTVSVDKPLIKMEFWTNGLILCPENSIQLSVKPGEKEVWTSEYTLFAKDLN